MHPTAPGEVKRSEEKEGGEKRGGREGKRREEVRSGVKEETRIEYKTSGEGSGKEKR